MGSVFILLNDCLGIGKGAETKAVNVIVNEIIRPYDKVI